MYEIDGSKKSGSGTILRLSIAVSAITEKPLHIFNIRHNRSKPGLRPQHLEAVKTAGKLCGAPIRGAKKNSNELWFNQLITINIQLNLFFLINWQSFYLGQH